MKKDSNTYEEKPYNLIYVKRFIEEHPDMNYPEFVSYFKKINS